MSLFRSCINRSLVLSLTVTPLSLVLAEHLRGNVLPAEQHVASDLPCVLHPDPHVEALTEQHGRSGTTSTLAKIHFLYHEQNCHISILPFFKARFSYFPHLPIQWGPMINTLPVDALNTLKGAQRCCKCLFLQRDRRPWLPNAAAEMIFSCLQGVVLVVTFMALGHPRRNSTFVL